MPQELARPCTVHMALFAAIDFGRARSDGISPARARPVHGDGGSSGGPNPSSPSDQSNFSVAANAAWSEGHSPLLPEGRRLSPAVSLIGFSSGTSA